MIRLALLLMGTEFVRARWRLLSVVGSLLIVAGVAVFIDALDGVIFFPLHAFALVMLGEAFLTLAFVNEGQRKLKPLRLFKGALFLLIALLVLGGHHKFNIALALLFGLLFTVDGSLRLASALLLRFAGWRSVAAIGVLELLLAVFMFEPYPTYYAGTVPYCIGLWLFFVGVNMARMALRLHRLPPHASIANFLSRGNSEGLTVYPEVSKSDWTQQPLTVHVWTAVGTAEDPLRLPVINRYLAAVDAHGMGSTGHAAMEASPDIYISHYPAVEIEHTPSDIGRILRATAENDVEGLFQPSYREEAAGWCESTEKVVFTFYNTTRLHLFWEQYRQKNAYNLTNRNCSTTVAFALETALEGVIVNRGGGWRDFLRLLVSPELWAAGALATRSETMVWTPGLMLDFARNLHTLVEPVGSGQAQIGAKGNDPGEPLSAAAQSDPLQSSAASAQVPPTPATPPALPEPPEQPPPLAPALRQNADALSVSTSRRLLTTAAVIAVATIFGLSYGLTAPLIAANMAARGSTEFLIGLNAAMHAVGVLAIAPFLPRLTARFGTVRLIVAALLASAAILTLFPRVGWLALWFPLRILLGVAAETLFVLSETWTNDLSDDRSRGQTMAIYTAALSLGFAGGPAILSVVGVGVVAYFVGATIAGLAVLPIIFPGLLLPTPTEPTTTRPYHYLRLAPVAIATTLLNAAVEASGLAFIPLYAIGMGWRESQGMRLVSTLMFGAVLLQLPIGLLADRVNPRRLALGLAIAASGGAALWPWTLGSFWLAYSTVFVWGGIFVGIYTVMLTIVGSRFRGSDLIGIYAMMSVAWGIGALIGPFLVGAAMHFSPKYGLPYSVALGCALFAAFMAARRAET